MCYALGLLDVNSTGLNPEHGSSSYGLGLCQTGKLCNIKISHFDPSRHVWALLCQPASKSTPEWHHNQYKLIIALSLRFEINSWTFILYFRLDQCLQPTRCVDTQSSSFLRALPNRFLFCFFFFSSFFSQTQNFYLNRHATPNKQHQQVIMMGLVTSVLWLCHHCQGILGLRQSQVQSDNKIATNRASMNICVWGSIDRYRSFRFRKGLSSSLNSHFRTPDLFNELRGVALAMPRLCWVIETSVLKLNLEQNNIKIKSKLGIQKIYMNKILKRWQQWEKILSVLRVTLPISEKVCLLF